MNKIKERRETALKELVSYKTDSPTETDWEEARHLMNSYYRLCALSKTNAMLANDENTCDKASTKRSEERELKWHERLNRSFEEVYGLSLVYLAHYPSIGIKAKGSGFKEKIGHYFYE